MFIGHCHGHIRNFIIKGMMNAATEKLKLLLEDDLSEFSSFERMSVNAMDLILAAYKEFHPGGAYAKGKGREFLAWVKAHFPKEMWIPILRAAGSRQDMSFDGAVPLFADRKILMEFLRSLLVPGSDNTLESFLYGVLRCNEMVALLRVLTLFDLVWSRPMRFLNGAASSLDDWGSDNSAEVLDLTEKMMVAIAADGHALLDPSLDPCAASTLTPNPNPHPNPHSHPDPNPNPNPNPNQVAFAHGGNDLGNSIGPLASVLVAASSGDIGAPPEIDPWVLLLGAASFVVGIALLGRRTIETVGGKITRLTPSRSFSVQMGTAVAVLSSTVLGLAVSTSHCLVGAVIGVGIVGRLVGEDSELNVSMLKKIVVGWAATIPLAMLVSVLAFKGIMFLYQGVGCA